MKMNQSVQDELKRDYRVTFQKWVSAQEELRGGAITDADRNRAEIVANAASSRYRQARNRLVDGYPAQSGNL